MADPGQRQPSEERADRLARYYDLDLEEDPGDLALYVALAERTEGPILELAAGSGRLAVPLARAGFAVTGIDHDPAMLARARRRWSAVPGDRRSGRGGRGGSLELVEADLLDAELGARFGLSILALNSLLVLETPARQARAIAALARHLRPGGLAVVDVWLPGAADLAAYDGRVGLEWERDDPIGGERVAKLASAHHDAARNIVELTTWFDSWPAGGGPVRRTARTDRLGLVGAAELVRMAETAGLTVEVLASDYGLTPFGPGAERAVLVGVRP